jgi:hypothetical protein
LTQTRLKIQCPRASRTPKARLNQTPWKFWAPLADNLDLEWLECAMGLDLNDHRSRSPLTLCLRLTQNCSNYETLNYFG